MYWLISQSTCEASLKIFKDNIVLQMSRHKRQRQARMEYEREWEPRFNSESSGADILEVGNAENYPNRQMENKTATLTMQTVDSQYERYDSTGVWYDDESESFIPSTTSSESEGDMVDDRVTEERTTRSLSQDLFKIYTKHNISRRVMGEILEVLSSHDVDVPNTVYKLKRACSNKQYTTEIVSNDEGHYGYFSIEENIRFLIDEEIIQSSQNIDMIFNIDGLPLFRSSNVGIWPILMKIENISYSTPLPVSFFCGAGKPDLSTFTQLFSSELTHLLTNGLSYGDKHFTFSIRYFVCDAVARSFVCCTVGHNGYNGCQYCRQRGVSYNGRMIFPEIGIEERSDEDYALCSENNQRSESPFASIIGLNTGFVPDPMHCVYLGVVKKLLSYYFSSTKHLRLPCRLTRRQIQQVSESIFHYRMLFGPEFQRSRLRPMSELEHFKAKEYRMFILYTCPLIMKSVLPERYFKNLLLLHFAMYVFASYTESLFTHAEACIHNFITSMGELFGEQSLIYNIHLLSHLSKFVRMYGHLDVFSAFDFENYLGLLKRRIRPTWKIFESVKSQMRNLRLHVEKTHTKAIFTSDIPNNCCIDTNDKVILIENVTNENRVCGRELIFSRNVYDYPYPSQLLKIGYYSKSRSYLTERNVVKKCLIMPSDSNEYLVLPLVSNCNM